MLLAIIVIAVLLVIFASIVHQFGSEAGAEFAGNVIVSFICAWVGVLVTAFLIGWLFWWPLKTGLRWAGVEIE